MIPLRYFLPCLFAASTVSITFAGVVVDVDYEHLSPLIGDPDGLDDGDRIQDVSGNGYHGFWGSTNNNIPVVATSEGTAINTSGSAYGKVFLRDGLTGIPDAWDGPTTTVTPYFTFDGSLSYTFEAVVNWNFTTQGVNGLMGQTGGNELWIRENGGYIQYAFVSGGANANLFSNSIDVSAAKADGGWHVISVVYDASGSGEIRSYLDGELKHTNTDADIGDLGTMVSGTSDFSIGAYNGTSGAYFDGLQDRYRISTGALIPAEFLTAPASGPGVKDITWTGGTDANWDETTTDNWKLDSDDSPALFAENDAVTFDGTAPGVLTLVGSINPTSITMTGASNYTFSGGTLGGLGVLEKSGDSTLTLACPTSRTGSTNITEGAMVIGDGTTSGNAIFGSVALASDTSLSVSRSDTVDYSASSQLKQIGGAGDFILDGGARLIVNPGTGTGFDDGSSWSLLSGGVAVIGGSELQTLRNGRSAMGSGVVTLGDGSSSGNLSQYNGSWTWTNDITLVGSANAIRNRSSASYARILKLQGIISGSGGLVFEDPGGSMTDNQTGYILTGENTLDGTVTIDTGVPVRVGGVPGDANVLQPGPDAAGSLGSAAVVNNGALTFSRTDSHTVANTISGDGDLFIGLDADSETQVVDLTGSATNDGDTTVRSGTLLLNGTHGGASAFTQLLVDAGATLGGAAGTTSDIYLSGDLAPGNSAGTLNTTGWLTLLGGSSYTWELGLWSGGTAGADSDLVTADEIRIDASAVPVTPITIRITPASLTGFAETAQTFVIGQATSAVVDFNTDAFAVDDSAFITATGATGSWAVQQTGTDIEVVYTAGSGLSGYALWISGYSVGGQTALDDDFDQDTVSNGIEFLLGGDPSVGNDVTLPSSDASGSDLVLTFERDDQAIGTITTIVQTSADLSSWPPGGEVAIGEFSSPGVSITDNGATDTVVVTVPKGGALKMFTRIKVTNP